MIPDLSSLFIEYNLWSPQTLPILLQTEFRKSLEKIIYNTIYFENIRINTIMILKAKKLRTIKFTFKMTNGKKDNKHVHKILMNCRQVSNKFYVKDSFES